MEIGPGDEVICPACTFYATAESIVRRGATPVFADVDASTMNLDPADVAERITPRTKAIMPVHLFGRPAPLRELADLGAPLIEDAAQAFGSPEIARTGVASTFSFYPTKNLFALGDGGLVSTDAADLAERVRMLRFHGSRDKVDFELIGYNSRLDEVQAAVLRIFLAELDGWVALRREAAGRYGELGLGAACELPEDEPGHAYHLFVCRSPERDRIRAALKEASIGSAVYYATSLHLQLAVVVAIKLAVFIVFGFYNRWWRYVSTGDMWGAARGVTVACVVADLVVYFAHPVKGFPLPRSIAVLDWLLLLAFVAGTRLIARSLIERPGAASLVARGKEVIVVGAGDAAQLVIREMLKAPALGYTPIGLIDDDPRKKNLRLHGIRVLGTTADMAHILRDNPPDEVLIAIPSASGETRQHVVETAQRAGVSVKTLPGIYELISGDHNLAGQIRPVQVEDVLGREQIEVDLRVVAEYLAGE